MCSKSENPKPESPEIFTCVRVYIENFDIKIILMLIEELSIDFSLIEKVSSPKGSRDRRIVTYQELVNCIETLWYLVNNLK